MSDQSIPEAARSPYPLHPAPIAGHGSDPVSEASATGDAAAPAQADDAKGADRNWADKARDTFDRATESKAAVGTAVGIGSAALVAALLFTRRGRKRKA